MPELEDRIRDELRRAAVPGDPSGVYEHVLTRRVRRHIAHQAGIVALTIAVLAGSITGAWTLSRSFRRATVKPTPTVPSVRNGKIAFVSGTDIFVMNPDGSDVERITQGGFPSRGPAWSPDGARIAFSSERPRGTDIYSMASDGSDIVRLTTLGADGNPAWSPDGRSIAFIHLSRSDGHLGPAELYIMNADGSGLRKLATHGLVDPNWPPSWSPDSTMLAYTGQAVHDPSCQPSAPCPLTLSRQIWLIRANGTDPVRLTDGIADRHPSWSPSGDQIVFAGQVGIVSIRPDGSDRVPLTHDDRDSDPVVSPDGSLIAFMSLEGVVVMSSTGSGRTAISTYPGTMSLAWQPIPRTSPAPSPSGLRPCTGEDYVLSASTQGATQALVPAVGVRFTGQSPCHLEARASILIINARGNMLNVERNGYEGASVTLAADLPAQSVSAFWFWWNWCGPSKAVAYRFSVGDVTAVSPSPGTPVCYAPGTPSRLSRGMVTVEPFSPSP